jgi:Flp pilus assembly protein TadD
MPARRKTRTALRLGVAALALMALPAWAEGTPKPKPRPDATAVRPVEGSPAGAYLAAKDALAQSDYAAAVGWFAQALALDPANPGLLDGAVTVRMAVGDIAGASQAARVVLATGSKSQIAVLAVMAADAMAGDFAAIKSDLTGGQSVGALPDSLVLAWADLGQGRMSDALAGFDKAAGQGSGKGFALYHKALAMASVGDFEGADAILSGPDLGPIADTRRAVLARVQVLAQLDRRGAALELLNRLYPAGADGAMDGLRLALQGSDPLAFDLIRTPVDGVAEVMFDMAGALSGQADDSYVLLFARVAAALRPTHVEALMLSAQLLQRIGQYDLATGVYAQVPPDSAVFVDAEIGRANAAMMAGQGDSAVATLTALMQSHPGRSDVTRSLADALRRLARFDAAVVQYDAAVALANPPQPDDWTLFYARAICLSELDRWPEAEADFRAALKLNPGQPQVLNYLGYSYVDRGENLDEALQMIQRAVMAAPDQGYIVDSLAWALYRLNRVKEAVVPMERASLLEPVDPIVTDHLGDVYWAVGRKMEARFQWRRALSFNPTEADAARIRHKLEVGLDQLLAEEKAGTFPPAAPATDAGNGG